ncbi:MAG: glycosyltransferase family 87 protein, partial [Acidimicrobiia bacterium]|nr:glycosyltransferase family 87 protein [Acidimicrobiia bacterium]MDX2468766.1 glycosyltransferase family 87 protein [Acidimicrobiia bacterium]
MSYRTIAVKGAYVLAISLMVAASVGILQEVLLDTARPTDRLGFDFAVFHGTGLLVVEGNGAGMYHPEVLGPRIAAATGHSEITSQDYRHPPFFALFFVPFAALPFVSAYLAFLVGGASALAVAISRVGLKRASPVVGVALLSVPGLWTIQLGQMGLWVGALLLAVFLSLRSEHPFRAGLLIGLLAFKPTYAMGIGIWWLFRAKKYAAAIAG